MGAVDLGVVESGMMAQAGGGQEGGRQAGGGQSGGSSELDLSALVRAIGRRGKWVGLSVLAVLILTFIGVSAVKPRYTAEAKVLLETQDGYFTRPDKLERDAAPLDPEAVQSQVQLVLSRDLARQAIRKLDLLSNPEFDPLIDGVNPLTRVLVLIGLQRDPTQMSPEDRVLETYYDKLTVFPVAKTRVLTVEFTSRSPELAAKAANTIAELYLGVQEEAKKTNAKNAAGWLSKAIDDLRVKVAQAEAKVDDFRSNSGLFVGANNTNIPSLQLSELNTQLATARAAKAESSAKGKRLAELIRQGRLFEISDIAKDDLIRRIGEQRVTLKAQLALESRTLLPGHPRIKELTAQMADLDNELRSAAEKTARALENDARVAASRVESIQAAFDTQRKAVTTSNSDDVTLRGYEREAKAAREQLESFLQKFREATARNAADASPADARIISRAIAPQLPSFPKKVPMLLIAGLGALFLSLGVVSAQALMAGEGAVKAQAPDAAPREMRVAEHVAEPVLDAADARPAARPSAAHLTSGESHPDTPTFDAPALMSRLANLRHAYGPDAGVTVLVAAPVRSAAATQSAIAMARQLATQGRTLIVDLDFEVPALDHLASPVAADGVAAGLNDLLAGTATIGETIHADEGSRLHIMPAGSDVTGEPHTRFGEIVDALRQAYDYIVLHGAPYADVAALGGAAGVADMAIVVAEGGAQKPVADALSALNGLGVPECYVLQAQGTGARREHVAA